MLASLDRQRDAVQQLLVSGGERQALDLDHRAARCAAGSRNSNPSRARAPRRAGRARRRPGPFLLQPADVRQLGLRLLRLRLLVPEPVDEPLEPGDVGVVALDRLRRVERARRLLAPPDVPLAGEVGRAAGFELEHRGRRRLQEPAVVRDQDDGRVQPDERALQPLEPLDVEVVGRLVEQQQVGIARQRPRQRRAGQLAAGERRRANGRARRRRSRARAASASELSRQA